MIQYPELNIIPLKGKNVDQSLDEEKRKKDGKAPAIPKGWTEEGKFEQNNKLVRSRKPEMYGILTGKQNNIIVIDYDIYNEKYNPEHNINLKTLKETHGNLAFIVKTQSGGFHVYHKYDDKFAEWGGLAKVYGYIDIRNTGNFVVGAGSRSEWGKYEHVNGNLKTLNDMPQDRFEWIDRGVKEKRQTAAASTPRPSTRQPKDKKEQDADMIEILKPFGFKDIVFGNKYGDLQNFVSLDEYKKRTELCPCCKGRHDSNEWYFKIEDTGGLYIKNHSDNCRPIKVRKYEMVKRLFERFVCRINDKLNYIVRDGEHLNLYAKAGILERFSHLRYEEMIEKEDGQEKKVIKKFIYKWMEDAQKRQFRTMDFFPEDCPEDVYNTWVPFAASTLTETGGSAEMFWELFDELTKGDLDGYAKKYLAFLVQKPNEKPTTCLVFSSEEGVGKGRMFYAIKKVFGRHLVTETNNPQEDIFGQYANAYDQVKLVIANESNATTNFKNSDRLKSLVSDEDGLKVSQKYVKSYEIRNLAATIVAGNGKTLVNKSVSDRRFVIYKCGEKFMQNEEYFGRFTEYINQPKNQRAVYDSLMAIDLTDFNHVKSIPKETEANQEAREKCLPKYLKFLEWDIMENMAYPVIEHLSGKEKNSYTPREVLKESHEDVAISATKYCEKFREYTGDDDRFINAVKFGIGMRNIIKEHKIPDDVVWKKDTKMGVMYLRNREKAVAWLKKNRFTSREPLVFE